MNILQEWQKKYFAIYLTINDHNTVYRTAKDEIAETRMINDDMEDVLKEVEDEMIRLNQFVNLQVYPNNGVGSYSVIHYDLLKAIEIMKGYLTEEL